MEATQARAGEPRMLPTGTVTFLFTDIEGSTKLLERLGSGYPALLEEHRRVLREAFVAEGGREIGTEGDSFFVVFESAPRAVAACVRAQRAVAEHPELASAPVRVRMGLHTGEGIVAIADYVGIDVHRAARIAAAGHGGQVLLSSATRGLLDARDGSAEDGVSFRDLGEFRLKDLSRPERIFQVLAQGLPADFPALRTLDRRPNNLPVQATSFIGRERELAEARRLLERVRLLTLTGPGGTGKTRLSLQLAAEASDAFADGVFFVPLASIFDSSLVPTSVAEVLGVQEAGSTPLKLRLLEFIRDKELLLVLDNFEQVTAAGSFVSELLQAAPGLKLVVTSRAVLRVYGEQEFPVPPLRIPDAHAISSLESLSQYEAVALFIQRARSVRPDFAVTNESAPAVAEICARLDGLPLAIELAAARVKILTPEAILARLDRRLALLSSGSRDLPERQQTLRGAIAWSYELLDEPQRRLFAALGAFVGGCTLDAAERVLAEQSFDVLEGITALFDQSLLRREDHHGESRFQMLETIREFAAEKLEESGTRETTRARHAQYYLEFAERAEPELAGIQRTTWLDRLEDEQDNLRAALDWAVASDAELALRLAAALWRYWQIRGHLHEGAERLRQALAAPSADQFRAARAKALEAAGGIAYWQARMEDSERDYGSALALNRELGDASAVARSLYNLSFPTLLSLTPEMARDDPELVGRPMRLLDESLALYRELGDERGIANCLWAMGSTRILVNDWKGAEKDFGDALAIFRSVGDRLMTGWALFELGVTHLRQDSFDDARSFLFDALATFEEADDRSGIVLLLDAIGSLDTAVGEPERGARLAGAAEAVRQTSGVELGELTRRYGAYADARDRLDAETATRLMAEGRRMSLRDAIAYALRKQ